MAESERYKTVKIEAITKLLHSVRRLVALTTRDPRYNTLSLEVVNDLIAASEAISKASQTRIIVDVPTDVMDTLTQIRDETKDMQKSLFQLQGMLMSLEAQKNTSVDYSAASRYAHQQAPAYNQRRDQQRPAGDNVQTLLDMMQDLSTRSSTRPPDDPRFQMFFTK